VDSSRHAKYKRNILTFFFCFQIAIVNGLYALGFLTRGLAFLYRPITHCFMPYWAFWLMAYYLAELPPVLFQFIAFWRLAKLEAAERKQKRFWAAKPANSGHTARSAARPIAGAQILSHGCIFTVCSNAWATVVSSCWNRG
jgi:hypothetical protein